MHVFIRKMNFKSSLIVGRMQCCSTCGQEFKVRKSIVVELLDCVQSEKHSH